MIVFLNMLLGLYLQVFNLGELLVAPLAMRISQMGSLANRSLLFISSEHLANIDEQRLNGPADLVIEIILTESVGRDRGDKFYEYQAGGVREYWVIDPRPGRPVQTFGCSTKQTSFAPIPIDSDGIYHSTVLPNFRLNVNLLLSDHCRAPFKVARELMGNDAIRRAFGLEQ